MTDKESPEKALFSFTGDSVLAEELEGGARHRKALPTEQPPQRSIEKSDFDFLDKFE
jgi:hypothetical protein